MCVLSHHPNIKHTHSMEPNMSKFPRSTMVSGGCLLADDRCLGGTPQTHQPRSINPGLILYTICSI